MIKYHPTDLRHNEYTYTLIGNEGEEQIVFITTYGQNDKGHLTIVSTQCDGKVKILYQSDSASLNKDLAENVIRMIIKRWSDNFNPNFALSIAAEITKHW